MSHIGSDGHERRYLNHVFTGFAMAAFLVALLFLFDTGQLRAVVAFSGGSWMAATLLWLGIGTVFTVLKCVIARLADEDDEDGPRGGGGRGPEQRDMIPIRVVVPGRDNRH